MATFNDAKQEYYREILRLSVSWGWYKPPAEEVMLYGIRLHNNMILCYSVAWQRMQQNGLDVVAARGRLR